VFCSLAQLELANHHLESRYQTDKHHLLWVMTQFGCMANATSFEFRLSEKWSSQLEGLNDDAGDPYEFGWRFIDTPGVDDPNGREADETHLLQITQALCLEGKPINVIALVLSCHPPRFSYALQKTLKVFDAFFHAPHTWDQVCLLVTNVHAGVRQAQRDVFIKTTSSDKPCMRDQII
jgi:hypothetical protein